MFTGNTINLETDRINSEPQAYIDRIKTRLLTVAGHPVKAAWLTFSGTLGIVGSIASIWSVWQSTTQYFWIFVMGLTRGEKLRMAQHPSSLAEMEQSRYRSLAKHNLSVALQQRCRGALLMPLIHTVLIARESETLGQVMRPQTSGKADFTGSSLFFKATPMVMCTH